MLDFLLHRVSVALLAFGRNGLWPDCHAGLIICYLTRNRSSKQFNDRQVISDTAWLRESVTLSLMYLPAICYVWQNSDQHEDRTIRS
jgi:hypothetical protein